MRCQCLPSYRITMNHVQGTVVQFVVDPGFIIFLKGRVPLQEFDCGWFLWRWITNHSPSQKIILVPSNWHKPCQFFEVGRWVSTKMSGELSGSLFFKEMEELGGTLLGWIPPKKPMICMSFCWMIPKIFQLDPMSLLIILIRLYIYIINSLTYIWHWH